MHKIEALAKIHDRDGFDCGSEPLNLFLKQTARQHATRGVSRTFVMVDEAASEPNPILGFFALNLCQIQSDALPTVEARKLPRSVAGVRLGRLAVSKHRQGHGLGKILLVAAMKKFLENFSMAGGIGLFFIMSAVNTRIVQRSNALSKQAYGADFRYDEAMLMGRGLQGRAAATGLTIGLGGFMLATALPPKRWALERFVLPAPGEGPSA